MHAKLATAGLMTGLTVGGYAYAALFPTSQLFGRTLIAGHDRNEIALTFDDGPNDPYTLQLLDLLGEHRVRAIFFLVGNFARQRPQIARAICQQGHLIGNHTMSHPSLMWERPSRVREELAGCNAVLEDLTGQAVHYFRPPFGSRRPDVLGIANELGLKPVMWNLTAHDWNATDPHALATRVQRLVGRNQRLGRGSNILLHDGGHRQLGTDRSVTVAATKILLEGWAESSLRKVAIDAWN